MQETYSQLTITGIKEETPGVKTFVLSADDGQEIHYKAGQYLTLLLPDHQPEIRRSYSITSAPALKEPLTIGVKRVTNGIFSRKLVDDAKVGDKLLTTGAAGLFTLPDNLSDFQQVFFLAAGSGITPVFSLLKTVLFAHPKLSAVLIYSNKTPEATVFRNELLNLMLEFPDRLTIEFLNSNAANLAKARLYKDLLRAFLREHAVGPTDKILCYLCGPENYMRMCVYALREEGVPLENIRREIFNTSKKIPAFIPPDTGAHLITLRFRSRVYTFPVQYPKTILQTAREHNIKLPYSCETGRCGNCAARCTSGKTWMSYNEVLTPRDIEKGITLTCVAFPLQGDVALEIL